MAIRSLKNGTFSRSLLIGNTAYDPPDFDLISTVTVGSSGASSVTFSSIPGTYTDLQIIAIAKTTSATNTFDRSRVQFNSDTASNYSLHELYSVNGSAYSTATANSSNMYSFNVPYGSSSYTNIFGAGIIEILDYANTNKYKTMQTLGGVDSNSTSVDYGTNFVGGNWRSTSAITSITFNPPAGSWAQYSSFSLYGIN